MDELHLVLDRFTRDGTVAALPPPSAVIRRRGRRRQVSRLAGVTLLVAAMVATPVAAGVEAVGSTRFAAEAAGLPPGMAPPPPPEEAVREAAGPPLLVAAGTFGGAPWATYAYVAGAGGGFCTVDTLGGVEAPMSACYEPTLATELQRSTTKLFVYPTDGRGVPWHVVPTHYVGFVPPNAVAVRALVDGEPALEFPVRRLAGIDVGVFAFRVGDGVEVVELVAVDDHGEAVARTGRQSFTYGCNPLDWLRTWCP